MPIKLNLISEKPEDNMRLYHRNAEGINTSFWALDANLKLETKHGMYQKYIVYQTDIHRWCRRHQLYLHNITGGKMEILIPHPTKRNIYLKNTDFKYNSLGMWEYHDNNIHCLIRNG